MLHFPPSGQSQADDSYPAAFFEGLVSELMAEANAIALIQSHGYISVDTTSRNTGMSLGGIGSAVTVTPAGTTPSLHFIPGYFIEGADTVPVRLTNFFFRERVLNYEKIKILDSNFFHQYLIATPLLDPGGAAYFAPGATADALERALARIVNSPTFYNDNKANFARWNLSFSDITQKYLATPGLDHRRLNWSILLDIFPNCLTIEGDYFTSLTADIDSKPVDGCKAYPADAMHYRCLYPVSETVYGNPGHKCRILKRHFSPIAAGNPKLCSLPLFRTEFLIENPTDETLDIALLQIQENIVGYEIIKSRPNEQDCVFYIQRSVNGQGGEEKYLSLRENKYFKGITLKQKPHAKRSDIDGEMHIGVCGDSAGDEIHITCCGSNYTEKGLIRLLNSLRSGRIGRRALPPVFTGKEPSSAGVCVNAVLKPGASLTLNFVTVLDFPQVRLANYSAPKKYVEYFPDSGTRLRDILNYYLGSHKSGVRFERSFCQSIAGRLTDKLPKLGVELKCAGQLTRLLLNNLSFFAEATVWDDRYFNVRECVDYPFFNSLDVYFYGSFGLMYFLPEVDAANIKAFSECVFGESDDRRRYWMYSYLDDGEFPGAEYYGPRLIRGMVPHDMGGAFDPRPNAYTWHDSNAWKDLAPKYLLLVLRNYRYTNDLQVLKDNWPAVQCVLQFQSSRIEPGHCLPFVDGVGDTFDNIKSNGISIYCASLWVAGLRAAAEIARILQEDELQEKYTRMADASHKYLRDALWDEGRGYYHYYSVPLSVSDLDHERLGKARAVLKCLKIKSGRKDEFSAEDFIIAANEYLYDNNAEIPAVYLELYARDTADSGSRIIPGLPLSNKLKRIIKKYALYMAAGGLIRKDFEKKISQESDDIFADQLVADLYLSLLNLTPLTKRTDRKRALKNIFDINYKINSPNIGAANLVSAEGRSLPEHQAQDVWVGIQHSIAANLLDCGMLEEFDELIMTVYKSIYTTAKIPFGVPEAFNGNRSFNPHYLVKHMGMAYDTAESIVPALKEIGVLTEDLTIIEESINVKERQIAHILHRHGIPGDRAQVLVRLLKAAAIKYTAGRYFRAGMVFSIVAVIDKMYGKPGKTGGRDADAMAMVS